MQISSIHGIIDIEVFVLKTATVLTVLVCGTHLLGSFVGHLELSSLRFWRYYSTKALSKHVQLLCWVAVLVAVATCWVSRGVCRESEWVCKGLHMLRSCMSIRSRLVGGNFMVFSVFFIVFTAFARCLHDKGWLLKPCSCSANKIFSRDPAEKLAGFFNLRFVGKRNKVDVCAEVQENLADAMNVNISPTPPPPPK